MAAGFARRDDHSRSVGARHRCLDDRQLDAEQVEEFAVRRHIVILLAGSAITTTAVAMPKAG